MSRIAYLVLIVGILVLAAGCVPFITPLPPGMRLSSETATPAPTATPEVTAAPAPTPFPTAAEVAPEETFARVGDVALLSGEHGISGKAIVMGLQTLIIQSFNFDGKGPVVDIRLVKGEDYEHPAAILIELEQRTYGNELVYAIIPSAAGPGTADRIAVYNTETGEVYAWATFD